MRAMQIGAKKVVSISYTLKDDAGEVIDSSAGGEPLVYIQGIGNLVPGLEKALEGRAKGDHVAVVREATVEELTHGHAHGPGGHH